VARDRTRRPTAKASNPPTSRRRPQEPARTAGDSEARAVRAALAHGSSAPEFVSALTELDQPTRARVVGRLQQTQGNAATVNVIAASRHGGGGGGGVMQGEEAKASGTATETVGPARETTFPITGASLAEVARAIAARREAGKVTWVPELQWSTDDGAVNKVDITVDICLELPDWSPPAEVGPQARAEWARWRQALVRHEQGHIELVHRYFDGLAERLLGQTPRAVRSLFDDARAALARASREYDAATEHGRRTGTVIDVHVGEAGR
jgi:Bacterial protein of unknown function (DUF922)